MALAQVAGAQPQPRSGGPSGLADVLDVLLDKALVVDAFVRVSLIGIELLTVDIRIVVASVDTYLRFAEAVNRLDLYAASNAENVPTMIRGEARSKTSRALGGGRDGDGAHGDHEDSTGEEEPGRQEGSSPRARESDGEESGGGIRGAISKVASKARERGKWDD
ncbi:MAG: gas vesicle protein GvpJ [Actinomycetota bacterium]